jgi:hypothetical protein
MESEPEAEVLLQVPRASVDEIVQPANAPPTVGTRRTVVQGVELLVLSLTLTEEQLSTCAAQLGVAPEVISARPNEPLVVILCGEYRVPLMPTVPCRRGSSLNYVFYVPNLPIGVNIDPTTSPDILEAFEFIIKTYGHLENGGIPPLGAGLPTDPRHPEQPRSHLPAEQQKAPPSSAYAAPASPSTQNEAKSRDVYHGEDPSAGMYSGMYGHRPGLTGAVGPAPALSHASLEEQQRSAAAEARNQTQYVIPRHPGGGTLVLQTMPDIQPLRTSTRIAHGLGEFARIATNILGGSSDAAARGVRQGAQHVVANTDACVNPVHVPEVARGSLRRSRYMTRGAVAVTGGFAAAVVGLTSVVSDQVSTRLRTQVPQGDPNAGRSGFDDVKEVGIAAIGAAAAVTDAAMDAARTLMTATSDGVTQVVTHKLGNEAGELTSDGLGLATDAAMAASNVKKAGLKSVAKATLKQTAQKTVA